MIDLYNIIQKYRLQFIRYKLIAICQMKFKKYLYIQEKISNQHA